MERVISAFEAPALLDAHPTLTRHALYERLTSEPGPKGAVGLTTLIADGVMQFGQNEYGWSQPISWPFTINTESGITAQARAYITADQDGPLAVVFLHLADYLHRHSWAKAGAPPPAFQIQAQWVMWLSQMKRLAFLVLADKRLVLYEIERDDQVIGSLIKAVDDIAEAIKNNSPPPVDAAPNPVAIAPMPGADAAANLDELVERWRNAMRVRAETKNSVVFADHAAEAATEALKSALPKGAHHESDGLRVHHNAKSGRLIEEKIDGTYF